MSLAALQRAFHAIAVGEVALAEADGLVLTGRVPAATRMRVYAHAYRARLGGVLAADYPRLRDAIGARAFERLVDRYLVAMPPSHPSLAEAGARLPGFLDVRGRPTWLADLARLERARVDVFVAADGEPLQREALAALPPEAFATLALRLVPAAQVVSLAWSVDDVWATAATVAPPPPRRHARTVLVWRRDLEVVHRTLDADEALALEPVAAGGTFLDVCAALADQPAPAERAIALVLRWIDGAVLAA